MFVCVCVCACALMCVCVCVCAHACVCVSVRARVCRCQGLDQGLVPAWIKSRWRPWQGRKPPVPTFSCSIQPSLLYFQWQHGMCDSLDLYLNAPSYTREKKRGGNKKRLVSGACYFFSWGNHTSYGNWAVVPVQLLEKTTRLERPLCRDNRANGLMYCRLEWELMSTNDHWLNLGEDLFSMKQLCSVPVSNFLSDCMSLKGYPMPLWPYYDTILFINKSTFKWVDHIWWL